MSAILKLPCIRIKFCQYMHLLLMVTCKKMCWSDHSIFCCCYKRMCCSNCTMYQREIQQRLFNFSCICKLLQSTIVSFSIPRNWTYPARLCNTHSIKQYCINIIIITRFRMIVIFKGICCYVIDLCKLKQSFICWYPKKHSKMYKVLGQLHFAA